MTNTTYTSNLEDRLIKTQNGEIRETYMGTIIRIEAYLEKQDYFSWILEINAIDNLADNGFTGILKVYDESGKIIRRKGINGVTDGMVERLAKEFVNNL